MVLDQSYETGQKLVEGKTKIVYELKSPDPGRCVIVSKDIITRIVPKVGRDNSVYYCLTVPKLGNAIVPKVHVIQK